VRYEEGAGDGVDATATLSEATAVTPAFFASAVVMGVLSCV